MQQLRWKLPRRRRGARLLPQHQSGNAWNRYAHSTPSKLLVLPNAERLA